MCPSSTATQSFQSTCALLHAKTDLIWCVQIQHVSLPRVRDYFNRYRPCHTTKVLQDWVTCRIIAMRIIVLRMTAMIMIMIMIMIMMMILIIDYGVVPAAGSAAAGGEDGCSPPRREEALHVTGGRGSVHQVRPVAVLPACSQYQAACFEEHIKALDVSQCGHAGTATSGLH